VRFRRFTGVFRVLTTPVLRRQSYNHTRLVISMIAQGEEAICRCVRR
jgi:hypothetical protein